MWSYSKYVPAVSPPFFPPLAFLLFSYTFTRWELTISTSSFLIFIHVWLLKKITMTHITLHTHPSSQQISVSLFSPVPFAPRINLSPRPPRLVMTRVYRSKLKDKELKKGQKCLDYLGLGLGQGQCQEQKQEQEQGDHQLCSPVPPLDRGLEGRGVTRRGG